VGWAGVGASGRPCRSLHSLYPAPSTCLNFLEPPASRASHGPAHPAPFLACPPVPWFPWRDISALTPPGLSASRMTHLGTNRAEPARSGCPRMEQGGVLPAFPPAQGPSFISPILGKESHKVILYCSKGYPPSLNLISSIKFLVFTSMALSTSGVPSFEPWAVPGGWIGQESWVEGTEAQVSGKRGRRYVRAMRSVSEPANSGL
jgi:hypothetical protein